LFFAKEGKLGYKTKWAGKPEVALGFYDDSWVAF
jgi:hypothetical protein